MTTEKDKEIGKRLKELREHQGYSTRQVGEYLGIDQSNYSKIEHGKRRLRKLSMLKKLCTLYSCTQEHILEGEPHQHHKPYDIGTKADLTAVAKLHDIRDTIKMLRDIQKRMEGG